MELLTTRKTGIPQPPFRRLAITVVVLLILSTGSILASSPEEYKDRVESARLSVEMMLQDLDSMTDKQQAESLVAIQQDIPATEKVEWSGGSIDTQNAWLSAKLKEFSDAKDKKKQRDILLDISERLLAISESTGKLSSDIKAERTKDQDKQKLAEILSRQEYQKPEAKEESLFQKWWRELEEWFARMFPKSNVQPGSSWGLENFKFILQVVVIVLVIAFVAFLLFKFLPFFEGRFGRKKKAKKSDRIILGERIGSDESASDLFSEAEQLARDGNLRSAIRKGYIAALCDLSDRKIVRLARHKTNRDYLRDVSKNETLFESMRGLTFNFETNWYGLRTAEQSDWDDFRERYKQTIANARQAK